MMRSKSIYIYLSLFFLIGAFSCSSGPQALFQLRIDADLTLPPALNNLDTHHFFIRDVPTRYRNFLSGSFDENNIGSVVPDRASLSSLFVNVDWGIIREISIHAISNSDPTLSREIFFHDRVNPSNLNDLDLFNSLSEVKDILLQDLITLEVRFNFWRITPTEIDTRITMNFNVNGPE